MGRKVWKTPAGDEAPCVCEQATVACAGVNRHLYCEECGHCWIRPEVSARLLRECERKAVAERERARAFNAEP